MKSGVRVPPDRGTGLTCTSTVMFRTLSAAAASLAFFACSSCSCCSASRCCSSWNPASNKIRCVPPLLFATLLPHVARQSCLKSIAQASRCSQLSTEPTWSPFFQYPYLPLLLLQFLLKSFFLEPQGFLSLLHLPENHQESVRPVVGSQPCSHPTKGN